MNTNLAVNISQVVVKFVEKTLATKTDWYSWKVPEKLPAGVVIPPGSDYERNLCLKCELHKVWISNEDRRMELAKWYVATWGGIRSNKEETLRPYINGDLTEIIELGREGIASWSKVLCIRDPAKYAIFDARVSASLNCLQILGDVKSPSLFPCLSTQNRDVKSGNKRLSIYATQHSWRKVKNHTFYDEEYLFLIREVAAVCGVCIQTIEMLLFSKTIGLLDDAFPNEPS